MTEITVRRACAADLDAVAALWKEMAEFHAVRDASFTIAADGPQRLREHLAAQLSEPSAFLAVAEEGGKVIGFSFASVVTRPPVFAERRYGSIWDMAVAGAARRRGVGGKLLAAARQWAKKQGLTRLEVRVATHNEAAQGFWKKAGYRPYMEVLFE